MHTVTTRRVLLWGMALSLVSVAVLAMPHATAAETVNHAPLMTSQPATTAVAGQAYQYAPQATDRDGDTVVFTLTAAPQGMALTGNSVLWSPTLVGTYNVIIEGSDQHGGYVTQAWQIVVSTGSIATLVVTPNDRPTVINVGSSKQFSVTGTDQYGNAADLTGLTWTVAGTIGTITNNGLFYAEHGGIGSVIATSGTVSAMIGVVAKDIRPTLVNEIDGEPLPTNTETAQTDNKPVTNAAPAAAEEAALPAATIESADTTATAPAADESGACSNLSRTGMWFILIGYFAVVLGYYVFERNNRSAAWWIFPLLMTAIGLIIYYKYICVGTFRWWPWSLLGSGVILTVWFKGKKKAELPPDRSQTQLPF